MEFSPDSRYILREAEKKIFLYGSAITKAYPPRPPGIMAVRIFSTNQKTPQNNFFVGGFPFCELKMLHYVTFLYFCSSIFDIDQLKESIINFSGFMRS